MIYSRDHIHLLPNVLFALEKNVYSTVPYICPHICLLDLVDLKYSPNPKFSH